MAAGPGLGSGFGCQLMYERSWVRILALYTGCTFGHFSHLFGVKIIIVFEKTENKQKRGRGWSI